MRSSPHLLFSLLIERLTISVPTDKVFSDHIVAEGDGDVLIYIDVGPCLSTSLFGSRS